MSIALVLILLLLLVIFFALDILPLDVVALAALSALLLTGILKPEDAFKGFGSDTVMMIAGLFVMTDSLVRTGIVDSISRRLHAVGGDNPYWLAILIMSAVAMLSAFISNTAATAVFVPAVIALAKRANISPSKLLMPLAFASILTSCVTLISTSTNIVISGLMTTHGMAPMGMFELAPVGIPITLAGLAYMFTLGMKLLPNRAEETLEEGYHLRDYLTEVVVLSDSPLVGKTLAESKLESEFDLALLAIIRDQNRKLLPRSREILQAGDVLLIEASADDIIRIKDTTGLEIRADLKLPEDPFNKEETQLVEVIIMPGSEVRGRTLNEVRFRDRFGLTVLAINRRGETLRSKLSRVRLRLGDVLLMQGLREDIQRVTAEGAFTLLSDISERIPRSPKAKYALLIFAVAIAAGTFEFLPFAAAVIIGAFLMLLLRVITPEEAYTSIDWRIIVLIGAMIAFGKAMESSGTASFLAQKIVGLAGVYGPVMLLGAFFILTIILTQPMSNQAAALVLLPVAIKTAESLQLNPRSFAMMIAVAASCSYLTPLEPSCVLVYGPGRYKFTDFFRVGALLTVIIFIIAILLVPMIWPLKIL
ncbi:MAG: SLC13 family permease [Acidobacteria bacterium]|nr:SLC13 family permease [Acidobacteriota bacterium]